MQKQSLAPRRQFVLDTNVLINDPHAPFNFEEHDVIICMTVLEELDNIKDSHNPRHSLISKDARLAIQNIKRIINGSSSSEVKKGVPIGEGKGVIRVVNDFNAKNVANLPDSVPDNRIIAATLHLQDEQNDDMSTVLVTKDINMQLKASAAGIDFVQDYLNELQISDLDYLSSGYLEVEEGFFDLFENVETHRQDERNFFTVTVEELSRAHEGLMDELYPNLYIQENESTLYRVDEIDEDAVTFEFKNIKAMMNRKVFGINPKNVGQAIAVDALMDPAVTCVQLTGGAGSGKTILALASALEQTIESRLYDKIIVTRTTPPIAEEIGFLTGDETQKMKPWLEAFSDSLEVLLRPDDQEGNTNDKPGLNEGFQQTVDMVCEKARLEWRSMSFMRGRSLNHTYFLLDEGQNTTPHQMKTILSRIGMSSKIVVLGNVNQVDARAVSPHSNGLVSAVENLKNYNISTCVNLQGSERSELASIVEETF